MKSQLKSFKSAFCGLTHVLVREAHMRFHAAAAATAIILGVLCKLPRAEMALLAVLCALVMALEAVNTCLELLCDLCSGSYSPAVKLIKDIAAGAVLVAAFAALFVGVLFFANSAALSAVLHLVQNPAAAVMCLLWLALCVLFVYPGPVKIKRKLFSKRRK